MSDRRFDLLGKTVLISGASGGIGRAAAAEVASRGGTVVGTGRDYSRLMETIKSAVTLCPGSLHIGVTVGSEVQKLNDIAWLGVVPVIHGIVHAAGAEVVSGMQFFKSARAVDLIKVHALDLFELVRDLRAAKKLALGASIVGVSSVAAHIGTPAMIEYSAAKGALEAGLRAMAAELAPKARANSVAFGAIETPMHQRILAATADAGEAYRARHALGFGKPQDAAHAIAWLLSDESKWVTGQTFVVDGGLLMKGR